MKKIKDTIEKLTIKPLESKTKAEEIMFSFPDLFVYAIRRMETHKEKNLYNSLKPIFDKAGDIGFYYNSSFSENTGKTTGNFYFLYYKRTVKKLIVRINYHTILLKSSFSISLTRPKTLTIIRF